MFGRYIVPFSGCRAQRNAAYLYHCSPDRSYRNEYCGRRRKYVIHRNKNKCNIFDFHYYSSFFFFLQYKAHTNIQLPKYRGEAAKYRYLGTRQKWHRICSELASLLAVIHCVMQQPFLFLSHVKYNADREEIVESFKFCFTSLSYHVLILKIYDDFDDRSRLIIAKEV
jgi:hypothetical protein